MHNFQIYLNQRLLAVSKLECHKGHFEALLFLIMIGNIDKVLDTPE